MTVHEFELFHGIVLTKLARSERPITLRMIETRPTEAWSAYTLNDEVDLYVKYSTTPRAVTRGEEGKSWSFTFGTDELNQMQQSIARRQTYITLVAGSRDTKADFMQVCLLYPTEICELIDFRSSNQQTLTIKHIPRKKIRVIKDRRKKFLIAQNRLEQWDVPCS